MRSELRVTLMGDFHIASVGEAVAVESPRLQALLAYLILHGDSPQPRRQLAFLFWPDSSEEQALTNLRQLLHQLRRILPAAADNVAATRRSLEWRSAGATCDVVELEGAWAEADAATASDDPDRAIDALLRATDLYAGDLLPSCYDEWIEPVRDRLRRRQEAALTQLVELLEGRRRYAEAVAAAARLLELDPLREETHRACIRLHGLSGEPALAAQAYRRWEEVLQREFGIEPSAETRELAERIARAGGELGDRSRLPGSDVPAPDSGGAAPAAIAFVGRHREWRRLHDAHAAAGRGGPRVALLAGEAGIGKSRLAEEVAESFLRQGVVCATARCYAAEGLLPFGPVAQWLRSGPLRAALANLDGVWSGELTRLLPELRRPGAVDWAAGEPEPGRRLRLFEALARGVLLSGEPTVLLLDDIQWCDSDTLEWLHFLLRFQGAERVFLLCTLRLGERAADALIESWLLQLESAGQLERIDLAPLDPAETRALGSAVGERDLGEYEGLSLYRETEGNPLFVVETMRARRTAVSGAETNLPDVSEDGHEERRVAGEVPARVRAVIRHRLAQLTPAARALVAYAATIGREVPLAVLRHSARDELGVVQALDELCQRALLRERSGRTYDFSHDRIREVAYLELSAARRALLHYQVARALETLSPGDPDVAGELARHLDRADRAEEAIPYYRAAADRARSLFANREAANHLERALALLAELPDTHERTELELELCTALGVPLVAQHHYSDPRVWRVYERASELSARLNRSPAAPVLRALALANLMRSRLVEVLRLGRGLLAAARESNDPILQVESDYVLGVAFYWRGRIGSARRHLQRALEGYDTGRARDHLRLYAQDPAIVCSVRLALADWQAGLAGEAHARCLEALARAEAIRHPFTLAYARHFACFVLVECGDLDCARRQVAALLREADEHGLANWPMTATLFQGWLRGEVGDELGVEMTRSAMQEYVSGGFTLGLPYYHGLVARGLRRLERFEEALAEADAGLAFSARTGERFWDSELLRLRGELLDRLGAAAADSIACMRSALRVARRQGSHALVARARRSLDVLDASSHLELPGSS